MITKRKALLAVVAVIVVIAIVSVIYVTGLSWSYVRATPFPDMNDSYPVYRTVLPDNSTEEIQRLSSLFGISGDAQEPEKSPRSLHYYANSGAFQYIIPEKAYPYATHRQPDLPSDEETRAIATNYLQERGLLPDGVYFQDVGVGSSFGSGSATSFTEYILTKDVHFVKEIRGLRIYNAGITVTLGENSEVVAVSDSLRELEPQPVRVVPVLTPEQAYRRLCSGDLVIRPACCMPFSVVRNISLGYWMGTQTESQQYVMPVYAFSCVTLSGEPVMRYVWAVDPAVMQNFT